MARPTEKHVLLSLAVSSTVPAVTDARDALRPHVRKMTPRLMHRATRSADGKDALTILLVLTKLAHGDMVLPITERARRRWAENAIAGDLAAAIRDEIDAEIIRKIRDRTGNADL